MDLKAWWSKLAHFTKHWSKEITIALILAVVAAIAIDPLLKWRERQKLDLILQGEQQAVATIITTDKEGNPLAQGSGVFISADGLLVTNYHVIDGATGIIAKLPSGAFYNFKNPVRLDQNNDIAVLQFEAKQTPYIKDLGDSEALKVGQVVTAIGTSQGLENSVSSGIISNPKQTVNGKELVQFTAPISSGNSGGGLFDQEGKIIGLPTESYQDNNSISQNLNFAVPINLIKTDLTNSQDNLSKGSPQYYYLLGQRADSQHDQLTAIQYYQKAIASDENYKDAYLALGGDYYDQGQYVLEVQNYERAAALDPKDSYTLYLLGTAFEDNGQYGQAIESYKKSLSIKPDEKDSLVQLITLDLMRGDKSDAAKYITDLSKLNGGVSTEFENILKRIR